MVLGSCNVFQKTEALQINSIVEKLDTITLEKEKSGLILNQDDMMIYFSKPFTEDYLLRSLDTLKQNIEIGRYKHTSERMITRYSFLVEELRGSDTIQIANIPNIDSLSLEHLGYSERMEMIENDENLKFGLYFLDIYCSLLEFGHLSIVMNEMFVDTIYKNRYSESTQYDSSSGISFTTKDGSEVFRCRPDLRFNLVGD